MMAYRICNWSRYEKADSKKCTTMQWVAIPIAHDGMGYIEIMARPDGVRIVGGWLLILQIAARCPTRGLLVTDSGRVLGAREIALKARAQVDDIKTALEVCCEQGWIEEVEVSGSRPDAIPTPSRLQDRTRQDKTVQSAAAPPPAREDAADALGMDQMQAAPKARVPKDDWLHWRQTHTRIFIGRSDEDGSAADWRALFDRAGTEVMDAMFAALVPTLTNPRHGIGYRAALTWIDRNAEEE